MLAVVWPRYADDLFTVEPCKARRSGRAFLAFAHVEAGMLLDPGKHIGFWQFGTVGNFSQGLRQSAMEVHHASFLIRNYNLSNGDAPCFLPGS